MTASPRKVQANRMNAKMSTGPRTPEGQATSAGNALKHGFTSKQYPVLPDEALDDFEALHTELVADLRPVGVLELALVRRIAECFWRLRRAETFETDVLGIEGAADEGGGMAFWRDAQPVKGNVVELLLRYSAAAERSLLLMLRELEGRQASRTLPP
jgi:hypothetical protein